MINISNLAAAHASCSAQTSPSASDPNVRDLIHSGCSSGIQNCKLALDCDICQLFNKPGTLKPDVAAFVDPVGVNGSSQSWMIVEIKEQTRSPDSLRRARNQIQAGCRALHGHGLVPVGVIIQGFILCKKKPSFAELQVLASDGKRGFTFRGLKIVPRVKDCGDLLN